MNFIETLTEEQKTKFLRIKKRMERELPKEEQEQKRRKNFKGELRGKKYS